MKTNTLFLTGLAAFSLLNGTLQSHLAHAQASFEYGGITSGITQREQDYMRNLPQNVKLDIQATLEELKYKYKDPSSSRDFLLLQAKRIIAYSKSQGDKLLIVQSLAAGVTLSNYVQATVVNLGPTRSPPGTIRQQVRILKQSFELAKKHVVSDQNYMNSLLNQSSQERRSSDWVGFGADICKFIESMSEGMLNAKANYAMHRWAIGVLQRKLMDDRNRQLFSDVALRIDSMVGSLPNPIAQGHFANELNDLLYIDHTRTVKRAIQQALADLKQVLADTKLN